MLEKICDRLWFEGDLKNLIDDSVEFLRTLLQNVFTSAVWSYRPSRYNFPVIECELKR